MVMRMTMIVAVYMNATSPLSGMVSPRLSDGSVQERRQTHRHPIAYAARVRVQLPCHAVPAARCPLACGLARAAHRFGTGSTPRASIRGEDHEQAIDRRHRTAPFR